MAKATTTRTPTPTSTSSSTASSEPAANPVEDRLVAFAERLGWMVGTVQAKAQGWLDPAPLADHLTRIRDQASDLLAHLGVGAGRSAASRTKAAKPGSADPAHAPEKRHRKPPPRKRGVKKSDERVTKMKVAESNRRRRRY